MIETTDWTFDGTQVPIYARSWRDGEDDAAFRRRPRARVRRAHRSLRPRGAGARGARGVVYGLDHIGHGQSGGERVLIPDFEPVVADVHTVVERPAPTGRISRSC